jgi:hypothetical protein
MQSCLYIILELKRGLPLSLSELYGGKVLSAPNTGLIELSPSCNSNNEN